MEIKIKKCPCCGSSRFEVYNGIGICKNPKCNYEHRVIPKLNIEGIKLWKKK